jgi:phenylacetate-coenzyme A ligase PaaK-like adenylate-forming protein
MRTDLSGRIFKLNNQKKFSEITLEIFNYQADNNPVYQNFLTSLGKKKGAVKTISDIPFLPVEFFRSQKVITENLPAEVVFESSRTSGTSASHHYVHDLKIYEESFLRTFTLFYGEPSDYYIAALLPSYTERGNSSLVYMMNGLINRSVHLQSGFFKNNYQDLISNLQKAKTRQQKTLLVGVSFALLDLAENFAPDLSGTIVMETGGMKGRRKEVTREELHEILSGKFNVPLIHSEYGMTELMSQAYSKGKGIFYCPTWMKIIIRDPQDPLSVISEPGRVGGINIIDLANLYSCSFIATGDLGKLHEDGGFEVLGRFENSDIRGCNLMVE